MWEVNCNMGWYRNYTNVFFDDYDFLLTPTLAVPAFKINDQPAVINGQQVIHPLWGFTPYSYLFNLTGNPAATIPIGFSSSGLPVGLQIVGDMWSEETILSASKRFEDVKPWGQYKPEI
jgi:aspartyl-tRNA(Asn)/glutamyl-tRNA(Gln) amidotransferase subunit A